MTKKPDLRKHPHLLEIQAVHLLGAEGARRAPYRNFLSIPDSYWRKISEAGFDVVWIMGVWKRSPAARGHALRYEAIRKAGQSLLQNCREEDFLGSPYAVFDYSLDPLFGKPEDLNELRQRLEKFGLRLILDFVSNHLAIDHPLISSAPEMFVRVSQEDYEKDPVSFFQRPDGSCFAHGRDPYFPAWSDTVQVNYFSRKYRDFCLNELLKIASFCDGVRCDMAMLGLNRIFREFWNSFLIGSGPAQEYWAELIRGVRAQHPDFIFIAEAYWDLEWEIQQLGFDFTYDKKLYDRLLRETPQSIRGHLQAAPDYQNKSMRFIENHDEPRAAKIFGVEKSTAAAAVMATIPGMRFFHEGQADGKMIHVPIQLARIPEDKPVKMIKDFYAVLLDYVRHPVIHEGEWVLLQAGPAWPQSRCHENLLVWGWEKAGQVCLVVVNYCAETSQGKIKLPERWLMKETVTLHDHMTSVSYVRSVEELKERGLYAALGPWKAHLFEFGI